LAVLRPAGRPGVYVPGSLRAAWRAGRIAGLMSSPPPFSDVVRVRRRPSAFPDRIRRRAFFAAGPSALPGLIVRVFALYRVRPLSRVSVLPRPSRLQAARRKNPTYKKFTAPSLIPSFS